jgi:hypothetical protein
VTREEVFAAHDEARRQVESRLDEGSEESFSGWSAKELLFHFASWQAFFAATLRARESGREATASEMLGRPLDRVESERLLKLDTDQTNAYVQELFRRASWTEARSSWARSCDQLRGEVGRLSDEQLAELAEGEPLWQRIGLESFSHVSMHLSAPNKPLG